MKHQLITTRKEIHWRTLSVAIGGPTPLTAPRVIPTNVRIGTHKTEAQTGNRQLLLNSKTIVEPTGLENLKIVIIINTNKFRKRDTQQDITYEELQQGELQDEELRKNDDMLHVGKQIKHVEMEIKQLKHEDLLRVLIYQKRSSTNELDGGMPQTAVRQKQNCNGKEAKEIETNELLREIK